MTTWADVPSPSWTNEQRYLQCEDGEYLYTEDNLYIIIAEDPTTNWTDVP